MRSLTVLTAEFFSAVPWVIFMLIPIILFMVLGLIPT